MVQLEHTKLREVVESIQICFDPDDFNTLIDEDVNTMEQYKEFENLIDNCLGEEKEDTEKSKWIIRMKLNIE